MASAGETGRQDWGGLLPKAGIRLGRRASAGSLRCCEVISPPSLRENGTGQQTKDEVPHLLASWFHP